jgi:murein DD-endopeptidase MepM/ murein hydrolase activator NlpD
VRRNLRTRTVIAIATAVAALSVPAVAGAASSPDYGPSSQYPSSLLPQGTTPATGTAPAGTDSGGAAYSPAVGQHTSQVVARRKQLGKPVLALFQVSRSSVYTYGRPATIAYQINDRSRYVRVRIAFVLEGGRGSVTRFNLGRKRTGVKHTFRWHATNGHKDVPQGNYHFRITARDPDGNRLVRGSQAVGGTPLTVRDHRFPVAGSHDFGGPDARFGTKRPGHSHQGQDITAAEGTPVVAPRGGIITWRAYQAQGAGYYLVLASADEPYNYVFMHLQRGSILVKQGDRVATGQQLANVGTTGTSSGPHLHFEIWDGPWYAGGKPIDPLPLLQSWE